MSEIGQTTIIFVGETKIALYKTDVIVAKLWDAYKANIPRAEDGSRVAADEQWDEFYATLTPERKQSISLIHQVPVVHGSTV